ncbi:MAG: hypothetical protein IM496_04350 [Microcystis sp. M049S2]|jgi:hypothetical protein|uniref:hypothetical protein n=1 Tax=Microcystis sp. M049S2 TaxID=2771169 RepID=UPI00258C7BC0|nr:hypothetical protein [Microcystis sp. M049S2]MCA2657769.1 hypothetical protein [Microcystis sp. M049S2]
MNPTTANYDEPWKEALSEYFEAFLCLFFPEVHLENGFLQETRFLESIGENFPQRMYIYNYRAFDLYQKLVISLAILGDERVNWRPDSYNYLIF